MKKKIKNEKKAVILSILFALIIVTLGCQLDNRTIGAAVNEADKTVPGTVWMELADPISPAYGTFIVEVHCNSGSQNVAAYGFDIGFDTNYVNPKVSVGQNGATTENTSDGVMIAAASLNGNVLKISGFDVNGKGPGSDLHILNVHFNYTNFDNLYNNGTTLTLIVDNLTNSSSQPIANAQGSTLKIGQ
ncbi:MAG: hypothetical protein JXR70_17195 [Spirochaetales bacterium]|nr:hypothetical protein [Spirochaetales bacterium]